MFVGTNGEVALLSGLLLDDQDVTSDPTDSRKKVMEREVFDPVSLTRLLCCDDDGVFTDRVVLLGPPVLDHAPQLSLGIAEVAKVDAEGRRGREPYLVVVNVGDGDRTLVGHDRSSHALCILSACRYVLLLCLLL